MIKIINVSKNYYLKRKSQVMVVKALDNINIHICENEIFGLIGLSGAGKTTLLRSIASLEKIDTGKIIINNQDINSVNSKNKKELKKNIGIVFQGYNLLKQTNVFENIAFPLKLDHISKEEIEKRVDEMLELVGLLPQKYAYPSKLSGGQMQRVAIARALITNPKVLLLDEVTSALDPITTLQILKLLKKINKEIKVTIVLITHDMKVVNKICDSIAIIYNGTIIEKGKKEEVLNNPQSEIGRLLLKEGDISD